MGGLQALRGGELLRARRAARAHGHQVLAAGQVVQARHRPYGVEFAKAADGTAFFLALTDGWLRELQNNPVTL